MKKTRMAKAFFDAVTAVQSPGQKSGLPVGGGRSCSPPMAGCQWRRDGIWIGFPFRHIHAKETGLGTNKPEPVVGVAVPGIVVVPVGRPQVRSVVVPRATTKDAVVARIPSLSHHTISNWRGHGISPRSGPKPAHSPCPPPPFQTSNQNRARDQGRTLCA